MALPDSKRDFEDIVNLGVSVKRDELPEIVPAEHLRLCAASYKTGEPLTLRVVKAADISNNLEAELRKVTVGVAPAANTYKFSPDQPDLSEMIKNTMPYYDYYLVELGLNVLVGRDAQVPALVFQVDLRSDAPNRTDVTAFDVMPRDEIKTVKVIQGKISVGISKLLNLIPGPIGQLLPNLLSIDINPIEFAWNFDKYLIDTTGPKSYEIAWKIYETNVVQGFNPTMILKVRKSVSEITARVRAIYRIKTGRLITDKEVRLDKKQIRILPL